MLFRRVFWVLLGAVVLLAGCGPAVGLEEFHRYKEASLAEAELPPGEEEVERQYFRVVAYDFEREDIDVPDGQDLVGPLNRWLRELPRRSGGARLVQRDLPGQLEEEVRLAQHQNDDDARYEGPDVADFAMRGVLSEAELSAYFSSTRTYVDDEGEKQHIAPRCNYELSLGGRIEIFNLPTLEVEKHLPFSINIDDHEPTTTTTCSVEEGAYLVDRAVERIREIHSHELEKFFAPRGFILAGRYHAGDYIFQVSLGTENAIEPGDEVKIIRRQLKSHPLIDTK